MKPNKIFALLAMLVILTSSIGVLPAAAAPQQAGADLFIRQISSSTTTVFSGDGNVGADINGAQSPEIAPDFGPEVNSPVQSFSNTQNTTNHPLVNRSQTREDDHNNNRQHGPLTSPKIKSSDVAGANPGLGLTFDGLNHRNQRLANGGNQFSLEPPDQGLCAGNGYVFETVNDVLRIFDTNGNALTNPVALNAFYGYAPAINRTTGVRGPFMTDPSCYFDQDTQRWFHVDLTLDTDPSTGAFLGTNHLDLAVSTSANPLGSWVIYQLPAQDDGTGGTPNHGCTLDGVNPGPCLGDYPHIGADKYGFYITTNEYSFFGPEFIGAQVYALSKAQLAANASTVSVVQFNTAGMVNSAAGTQPGFTVWPATSPASKYFTDANGAEFFMSSNAGEEANGVPGGSFSNELVVWAMTNTKSLNSGSPNPSLTNKVIHSETYGIPPKSAQKVGDFPLGQCFNDTACATFLLGGTDPFAPEVISQIDSNDTRMQQVVYANGNLWGALDTVVTVKGQDRAGIAYFQVSPDLGHKGHLDAEVVNQGYVGLKNNNVTYPAISVLPNGNGVMAFTLVGQDYYPSAGYVTIDKHGAGDIHVAAAGLGPDDGFTSYKVEVGDPPRTRWGDYGAAVVVGSDIWFASEYIGQTCTLAQFEATPFGSCGGTRTTLANWGTRISKVTP